MAQGCQGCDYDSFGLSLMIADGCRSSSHHICIYEGSRCSPRTLPAAPSQIPTHWSLARIVSHSPLWLQGLAWHPAKYQYPVHVGKGMNGYQEGSALCATPAKPNSPQHLASLFVLGGLLLLCLTWGDSTLCKAACHHVQTHWGRLGTSPSGRCPGPDRPNGHPGVHTPEMEDEGRGSSLCVSG